MCRGVCPSFTLSSATTRWQALSQNESHRRLETVTLAKRYRVRLHLNGIGKVDATVDGSNRWRLADIDGMDADMHAAVTEAVADVVAVTRPPDYLAVQDMR